jgi:hypothetical protein
LGFIIHWSHGHDEAYPRRNKPQTQTSIGISRSDANQKRTESDSSASSQRAASPLCFDFLSCYLRKIGSDIDEILTLFISADFVEDRAVLHSEC